MFTLLLTFVYSTNDIKHSDRYTNCYMDSDIYETKPLNDMNEFEYSNYFKHTSDIPRPTIERITKDCMKRDDYYNNKHRYMKKNNDPFLKSNKVVLFDENGNVNQENLMDTNNYLMHNNRSAIIANKLRDIFIYSNCFITSVFDM